jgi:type I restriction enzyme S subunit
MKYKTYKIKDLINEISMGPFGSNIKVECFVDSGIPVLNGSNLTGFALNDNSFRYVTPEKADSLGKANAYRGDIVITHRGTLGQIVFIPENSKHSRYVISQSQFRVKCNEKILPEYLVYYFHTNAGQHKLLSNASQVGVPALARASTTFQTLEIDIPDVTEQRKIVDLLETIREKIELNNAINNNLLEQALAIYKDWFCDYALSDGILPENWKITTIDAISSLVTRGIAPKYDDSSDQIVLNQKCIRDHTIDISLSRRHLPKKINEKWISKGDLLINSTGTGTLGRVAQVWFEANNMTVDSHVTIVRPKDPILQSYIGFWGLSHESEIEAQHTGSTGQTELPRDRVKAMELPLPDEDTLSKFNELVIPMTSTVISNQEENDRLSQLRDALLPKLMSSELDVSDIDL